MAKRLYAFRVIVGTGYDRNGDRIPIAERGVAEAATRQYCCIEFGGATIGNADGLWVAERDDDGNPIKTVREPALDITILRPIDPDDTLESAYRIAIAQDIGRLWNQHSVVIIGPDGRASIIES